MEARSCEAQVGKIRLQPSQSISNALVSENYPDNYPDNACQKWHIVLEGPNPVFRGVKVFCYTGFDSHLVGKFEG